MRLAIVLLVACSSTPRDQSPPRPTPVDAAIDATVDAPMEAAVVYGPCNWHEIDPKNPNCAPELRPLMRCRDVNGPNARFPKCIEDKKPEVKPEPIVLAIKRIGELTERGLPIVVDGGTNRGIDKTWRADMLDAKKKAVPSGRLSCVRLDPDELECLAKMGKELAERGQSVRFTPPER